MVAFILIGNKNIVEIYILSLDVFVLVLTIGL